MKTYKDYLKDTNEGIGIEMYLHSLLKPYGKITTEKKNHHYIVDFHEADCKKSEGILGTLDNRFKIKKLGSCKIELTVK